MSGSVTFGDVCRAAEILEGRVVRTPCAPSRTLSDITGADVVQKLEIFQFTASYKERGARVKLESLGADARAHGVVAMSAGNHAQAVAHHASQLGIDATIVMPADTPLIKVTRTEQLGARVVVHGVDLAAAAREAHRLEAEEGLTFVAPFDDPHVIAGQGTVALELFADAEVDAVVVPVGGGGLLAGMAVVAAEVAPHVELVGVESELHAAVAERLGTAPPRSAVADWGPTIADGIAVSEPGELPLSILAEHGIDVITVPEERIEEAVALHLEVEKLVVEGAGAAALAALLAHPDRFAGRRVGLVVSGGNIDLRLLSSVIRRGLVRSGRLSRLEVGVDDRPGALGELTAAVGDAGANIVEVAHQRDFATHSARQVDVELVVETRDAAHADEVVRRLIAAGHHVQVLGR